MKVVFFQSRSVWSALVRWFTRGTWSHVGILDDEDGVVYESMPGRGVVATDARRRLSGQRFALFEPARPLTWGQVLHLRRWLRRELGKGYDWRGLARFLTRRRSGDDARLFCSEYVAEGFQRIGRPLSRAAPWLISPEELSRSTELRPWGEPEYLPARMG